VDLGSSSVPRDRFGLASCIFSIAVDDHTLLRHAVLIYVIEDDPVGTPAPLTTHPRKKPRSVARSSAKWSTMRAMSRSRSRSQCAGKSTNFQMGLRYRLGCVQNDGPPGSPG
jgi:hypothetical protein